ncbi:MAG: hypothetical protein R6U39_04755 [Candidatus Aegiribacteria sp.]
MTILSCLIAALSGIFSVDYLPPPDGIGSEILAINTRSLGMGGVCVGIPNSSDFTMLNPAASAWTLEGGVAFTGRYSESDDAAWDNRLGFPMVAALIPLPGRVVITGAIEGRSRIDTGLEGIDAGGDHTGNFTWSGGLAEAYAGASVRASDWLGLSLGGRSTFGNIRSDVELISRDSVPPIPINSIYRDDARFRMAWGAVAGLLINTDRFGLGLSISTDRKGTLRVERAFSLTEVADSTSSFYTIPGEVSAGLSFRPVGELLVGMDIFGRKAMNVMGSRTEGGTIYSVGAELDAGGGIQPRCGYSYMDGLWRDGAQTLSAGAGYSFNRGTAGLDLAVGYSYWRDFQDSFREETVLSVSLWASEKWLGR